MKWKCFAQYTKHSPSKANAVKFQIVVSAGVQPLLIAAQLESGLLYETAH